MVRFSVLTALAAAAVAAPAGAATFGLAGNPASRALDGSYGLPLPELPYSIVDYADTNGMDECCFGGLTVDPDTTITATYIGSEAGADNGAMLAVGGNMFSNKASKPGDYYTFKNGGHKVNFRFMTNNLGGDDYIDNKGGQATDGKLHMAFSDIRGADGVVPYVYAFFGDGQGDDDYDDMVVRFDIGNVSPVVFDSPAPVPVPAAGLLLFAGLIGMGAAGLRSRGASRGA